MDDLHIFVIHYTPLFERKAFLLEELTKHNLNYTFIEKFDKLKLSEQDLIKFDLKRVKLSMCSNIRKHIEAYEQIISSKYKYNLIIEDDVILDKNFNNKLSKALKQLPNDYDMLFIGNGCNLHIPMSTQKPNKFIYKKCNEPTRWGGNGATRCMDSILISQKCATKICNYYESMKENSVDLPIDWWLNEVIRDLKLEIYWMEPTIITQGSGTGKYKSSH